MLLVCGRNPDADALLRNNCEMLDEMVYLGPSPVWRHLGPAADSFFESEARMGAGRARNPGRLESAPEGCHLWLPKSEFSGPGPCFPVRGQVHEEDGFIYNKDAVMMNDDGSERTSLETHMLLYCDGLMDAKFRMHSLEVSSSKRLFLLRWNCERCRACISGPWHVPSSFLVALHPFFDQVELHRTKSQCLNKLVYAWQGHCC